MASNSEINMLAEQGSGQDPGQGSNAGTPQATMGDTLATDVVAPPCLCSHAYRGGLSQGLVARDGHLHDVERHVRDPGRRGGEHAIHLTEPSEQEEGRQRHRSTAIRRCTKVHEEQLATALSDTFTDGAEVSAPSS